MLLIKNIKLKINEDDSLLKMRIKKHLKISNDDFSYKIYKKSIDARKEVCYIYQVLVTIKNEKKYIHLKDTTLFNETPLITFKHINNFSIKPIIIGYGPSGIFAAYRLSQAGLKPIIIEKGKRIEDRQKDVELFFKKGLFNPNSNIQFGEGGAGTFSDAKLTTRKNDPYINYILDVFIENGAEASIRYNSHPHIGTDKIRQIIKNITNKLIKLGCEFHFEEEVINFNIKNNTLESITTNKNTYKSQFYILATGHSNYDIIKKLYKQNVSIEPKDYAIGFRVEHYQSLIDNNQYHGMKSNVLEPSEYFLTYKDYRNVYSFCMCPGGIVIPANSEKNHIVTNGMSYSKRDSKIANAAILVQVTKEDYGNDIFSGFEYLKQIETKAYNYSNTYKALSQNIVDYIDNVDTKDLLFKSTYPLDTINYNFNNLFTKTQNECFKNALINFDSKIKGFIKEGIMIGPETKTSCPIRILKKEDGEAINTKNLYPIGEGSGYGGGIISCALDGIRLSNKILDKLY